MEQIIKKAKEKGWDIFRYKLERNQIAGLLADREFCIAIWDEKKECTCKEVGRIGLNTLHEITCPITNWWKTQSIKAFEILQDKGEKACIKYIKKTLEI